MEHGLTAGVRKADALARALQMRRDLGHIRQHLGEGSIVLRDPELLVDLPLGVKIPVVRGSKPVYCRAKLGEKLQRPSGFYDLGDPHCRLLRTEYNSLHDPYLQDYHNRKNNFQRLRRQGLVTRDGRVVCTLKEFNEYRQYLTTLKLRAEQMSRQEEVTDWEVGKIPVPTVYDLSRIVVDGFNSRIAWLWPLI
ncbi:fibrous sheath-interacting protein 2-like [Rissa tridactyla]|uniref:fibrous sheath-interacting protein 2-like n=1 Tax=Rissa tridactyla TaxID=75485 RepID=UPI0023BA9610|nr:fibrous sheath-interacting protein 2-like [Rissa tridactyla]